MFDQVRQSAVAIAVVGGLLCVAGTALAADEFPISGTFTRDRICKGDGTDAQIALVKITGNTIDSAFGLCTVNVKSSSGDILAVQTMCTKKDGSVFSGDITFNLANQNKIGVEDQDHVYSGYLSRCPSGVTRTDAGPTKPGSVKR